jgi:hypothetical protein
MIVHCPSCSANYRHDPAEIAVAVLAECSRCDERFELRGTGRSYRLATPGDPSRNARVAEATPAAIQADLTVADPIEVDPIEVDPIEVDSIEVDSIEVDPFGSDELADPGVGGLDAADSDLVRDELAEADAQPVPPRSALLEFLIAVVPPSTGASLAYYFAGREQLDPVAWSALGGAVGFLLGWGSLLWIRRKD